MRKVSLMIAVAMMGMSDLQRNTLAHTGWWMRAKTNKREENKEGKHQYKGNLSMRRKKGRRI